MQRGLRRFLIGAAVVAAVAAPATAAGHGTAAHQRAVGQPLPASLVGRWDGYDRVLPYAYTFEAAGRYRTSDGCTGTVAVTGTRLRLTPDPGLPAVCQQETHTWSVVRQRLTLDGYMVFVDQERCLRGYWTLARWQQRSDTSLWSLFDHHDGRPITLTEPTPRRDRVALAFDRDGTGSAVWDVLLSADAGGHTYAVHHTGRVTFSWTTADGEISYGNADGRIDDTWLLDGRQVTTGFIPLTPLPSSFECDTRLDLSGFYDDISLDRTSTPPVAGTPL